MKIGTVIYLLDDANPDEHHIKRAALMLREGKTVVFPTETVYGLGAHALDEDSVEKIYKAKGRPSDNPLIVHIHSREQVLQVAKNIGPQAQILMDKFWPGPLTLVLEKQPGVPKKVTGGLDTVALRMPKNPIALKILREAGIPVAAPSANLSGKSSPTNPKHVIEDLLGRVDCIVAAGESQEGLESTVVDMTRDVPVILRPGTITMEDIAYALGQNDVQSGELEDQSKAPRAPGMKYAHYCPRASMMLVRGEDEKMIQGIRELVRQKSHEGKKAGIMATDENLGRYKDLDDALILSMGSRKDLKTIARGLFKTLRSFDDTDVDIIICEWVEERGLGIAIMNRLKKAASGNITKV